MMRFIFVRDFRVRNYFAVAKNSIFSDLQVRIKLQHRIDSQNEARFRKIDLKLPVCSSYILASLQYQTKIADYHQRVLEMCSELFKSISPSTLQTIARMDIDLIALLWLPVDFVGDYTTQRICIKLIDTILKQLDDKERRDKVKTIKTEQSLQNILLKLAESGEDRFEEITRELLNKYNTKVAKNCTVFSFYCVSALFGGFELLKPEKVERFWIDFNYASKSVSLLCRINTSGSEQKELSIKILIDKLQIENQFDCIVFSVGPAIFSTDVSNELKNSRVAVFTLPPNQLEILKMKKDLLDYYNVHSYSESSIAPTPNTIEKFLGEATPYTFEHVIDVPTPDTIDNYLSNPNTPYIMDTNERDHTEDVLLPLNLSKQAPESHQNNNQTKYRPSINASLLSHPNVSFTELARTFKSNKESGYNTCSNLTVDQNTTVFKKPSKLLPKRAKPTPKPRNSEINHLGKTVTNKQDELTTQNNADEARTVLAAKISPQGDKQPHASTSLQTSGILFNQHQSPAKMQAVKPVQKKNNPHNLRGKSLYTSTPLQTPVNLTQPSCSRDKISQKTPTNDKYLRSVQVSVNRTSRVDNRKRPSTTQALEGDETPMRSSRSQPLAKTDSPVLKKKCQVPNVISTTLPSSWQPLNSSGCPKVSDDKPVVTQNKFFKTNKAKPNTAETTLPKPKSVRKKPVKNANSKTNSKAKRVNAVKPLNQLIEPDSAPKESFDNGGFNNKVTKLINSKAPSPHFTEEQRKQILQDMKIINGQNKYQLRIENDKDSDTDSIFISTPSNKKGRKRKTLAKDANISNFVSYASWKENQKNKTKKASLSLENPEKENEQISLFDTLKLDNGKSVPPVEDCAPNYSNDIQSANTKNNCDENCECSASSYSNHSCTEPENEEPNTVDMQEKSLNKSPEAVRGGQPQEDIPSHVDFLSEQEILNVSRNNMSSQGSSVSSILKLIDPSTPCNDNTQLLPNNTANYAASEVYEDNDEAPEDPSPSNANPIHILNGKTQLMEYQNNEIPPDVHSQSPINPLPINSWYTERFFDQLPDHRPTSSQGSLISISPTPEINQNENLFTSLQQTTTNHVIIQNHYIVSSSRKRHSSYDYREASSAKMLPVAYSRAKTFGGFAHLLPTYKEKITAEKERILNEIEQKMNANIFDKLHDTAKEVTDSITNHETKIKEVQEEIIRLQSIIENLEKNKFNLETIRFKIIGLQESSILQADFIDQIYDEAEERLLTFSENLKKDLWKEFSQDIVARLEDRMRVLRSL